MPRPSILIVDDEPAIRQVAARTLRANGYVVEEGTDGEDGLRRIQAQRPDVLLVDLRMPKLDGIGLLREVAAMRRPPIVVVMSAYGEVDDVATVMGLGAVDFLSKPFGLDDLRRAISTALEQAPAKPAVTFDEHLQNMRRHVRSRRFDLAEIDVRFAMAAARSHAQRAEASFFLGALLELKEEPASARAAYAAALAERPDLVAAMRRVEAIDRRTSGLHAS